MVRGGEKMGSASTRTDEESPRLSWGSELPMVGRRAELSALRLALDDAIDGKGHTIFLSGEAGVGKSRLVSALAKEAAGREVMIAVGRASAVEATIPYGVIGDALIPALKSLDEPALALMSRGVTGDLRLILPSLPDRRAAGEQVQLNDPDLKGRLLWNFAQFVRRLAGRAPILLVLENGQWFDPSSTELIHFLARQIVDVPVTMIVTYSSDDVSEAAGVMSLEHSLSVLGEATVRRVLPLTLQDTTDLLQRTFGLEGASSRRASEALHRRTMGNAFFLEEMLKSIVETGALRQVEGRWVGGDMDSVSLPTTIRQALRVRIRALSEPAQRVASTAAIVGTYAPLTLLERVSGLESTSFLDAVELLCARRVLVEVQNGGEATYEFSHPLLQATVLADLSAPRVRALHIAVADALERYYG
ncbi:MAG: AAA family ATPase, partial [Gemmatimonadaceae bacterium]